MAKNKYDDLRDEFDRLGTDQKFQFAVEAILKTIGDVANKAADAVHSDDAARNVAAAFRKMADDIQSSFNEKPTTRPKRPRRKTKPK